MKKYQRRQKIVQAEEYREGLEDKWSYINPEFFSLNLYRNLKDMCVWKLDEERRCVFAVVGKSEDFVSYDDMIIIDENGNKEVTDKETFFEEYIEYE